MNTTQKAVQALVPPAAGNRTSYDDEIPGFGARVTSKGVASFVLEYRINGRHRLYTIRRLSDLTVLAARERAIQLRGKILDGVDPLQQRLDAQSEPTMNDLAKDYLERYAKPHKRASSLRNDRQMLEKIILPKIGSIRVCAISRRDIETASPIEGHAISRQSRAGTAFEDVQPCNRMGLASGQCSKGYSPLP